MALTDPPGWLQNAGATHSAAELRTYLAGLVSGQAISATSLIARGGVHPSLGSQLSVTQTGSPSMAVLVNTGVACVPGTESSTQGNYYVANTAQETLSIAAAHATLPRIDIVVINVRDSQYSGASNDSQLQVITGTPASSPVAPTAPNNSITLAQVAVGAAVTSITDANITDTRFYLAAVGGVIRATSTTSPSGSLLHPGQQVFETDSLRLALWNGTAYSTIFTGVNFQVFTSSGTWTKPAGAQRVRVRCVGGGGAGGSSNAANSGENSKGGGGGGGGYGESWLDASALASTVTVTVGAGGTAGGSNGGTSSFGTHVTANGGSNGGTSVSSAAASFGVLGGAGGTAGTANIASTGQAGGMGVGTTNLGVSGVGGNSALGGGAQGRATGSTAQSLAGNAGGLYGGGGGGALSTSTGAGATGGAGAAGIVIVETFGI